MPNAPGGPDVAESQRSKKDRGTDRKDIGTLRGKQIRSRNAENTGTVYHGQLVTSSQFRFSKVLLRFFLGLLKNCANAKQVLIQ